MYKRQIQAQYQLQARLAGQAQAVGQPAVATAEGRLTVGGPLHHHHLNAGLGGITPDAADVYKRQGLRWQLWYGDSRYNAFPAHVTVRTEYQLGLGGNLYELSLIHI